MSRFTGATNAELQTRIANLEQQVSRLTELLKMRSWERTPRLLLPDPGEPILWGITDAAIAKDASGTVSIWDDGGDTGDNATVVNKIGSILISKDCYFTKPQGVAAYHMLSGEC